MSAVQFVCKDTVDNIYYISQGMGIRKVTISKSDLQAHSKSLVITLFDRPHTTAY